MNMILTTIVLAVPAYMAFCVIHGYATATGSNGEPLSTWQRLVAAFRGSASIFWARFNALSIAAIGAVGEIASLAGAPGVKDAIQPYLAPEYMTAYVLFVLIGAEIARRRTLAS
jgi:hypothetical protein